MEHPLVSVICLCYNHENYLEEAVQSILSQSYHEIELIIVDDHSEDNSVHVIEKIIGNNPGIKFIKNQENLGNCKSFNKGFEVSEGEYIIDHSTDDILFKDRIREGINTFLKYDEDYGVNFCDAIIIDKDSKEIDRHYKRDRSGDLLDFVPQGNIYSHILKKYFICPPTMMVKRKVLEQMGGYDENLAYEDFDFWVRSSRNFKYCFTDQVLVAKRELPGSLSARQYTHKSDQMQSTFEVCNKAFHLNQNVDEEKALNFRIKYEIRQCLRTKNFDLGLEFNTLLRKNKGYFASIFYKLLLLMKIRI
jgi:glycosyltransferase involved in cell wall biosynthesis